MILSSGPDWRVERLANGRYLAHVAGGQDGVFTLLEEAEASAMRRADKVAEKPRRVGLYGVYWVEDGETRFLVFGMRSKAILAAKRARSHTSMVRFVPSYRGTAKRARLVMSSPEQFYAVSTLAAEFHPIPRGKK